MRPDVREIQEFYGRPLGKVARRIILRHIRALWPNLKTRNLVGLGYPTPYLDIFTHEAERVLAFMPAPQGVTTWPPGAPVRTALVEEDNLPLPDGAADNVLAVHSLETSDSATALLQEIWRILCAGGRLILVVPNRRGPWAGPDTTPFGHGQPFSRGQLTTLFKQSRFSPLHWRHALYVPPFAWPPLARAAMAWERAGARLWPPFSGVFVVEAEKVMYGALPVSETEASLAARLRPIPALGNPRRSERKNHGESPS